MKQHRGPSITAGAILALLLPGFAGASQANPYARLKIWEGRWSYTELDYETAYSHAHKNTGTANCNWTANGGFVVCDYLNRNPSPDAPANDLVVYTYNPAKKKYSIVTVFKDRKPLAHDVTVEGNTWITSTTFSDAGKTYIYRDVYVFSPDARQRNTAAQISSDGGKTWTTVTRFRAVRVSDVRV